jgi:hypothetical protein
MREPGLRYVAADALVLGLIGERRPRDNRVFSSKAGWSSMQPRSTACVRFGVSGVQNEHPTAR